MRQSDDSLSAKLLTQCRFARGKSHEIRRQTKASHAVEIEVPVRHEQRRALRVLIIEQCMRREVEIAIARVIQRQSVRECRLTAGESIASEQRCNAARLGGSGGKVGQQRISGPLACHREACSR